MDELKACWGCDIIVDKIMDIGYFTECLNCGAILCQDCYDVGLLHTDPACPYCIPVETEFLHD